MNSLWQKYFDLDLCCERLPVTPPVAPNDSQQVHFSFVFFFQSKSSSQTLQISKLIKHVRACVWNKMTFESVLYLVFLVVLFQASILVLAAKQA